MKLKGKLKQEKNVSGEKLPNPSAYLFGKPPWKDHMLDSQ